MKLLANFSATEKRWALLTAGVAVAAIVYSFAVEPGAKHAVYSNSKMRTKAASLKKSLKNLAGYETLQAEYQRLAKEVPSLKDGGDATESLGLLEKMAGDSSVFIVSVKPQVLEEEEGGKRIIFDLVVHANPKNLTQFLYRLENSPHLLRVKRLTVSSASQEAEDLQATLILSQLAA